MAQNRFPEDLIKLKQQQIRTFNRLALQPATGTAELRSELTRLFCLIGSHPHWQSEPLTGRARSDLHHQAVAAPGGGTRARRGIPRRRVHGAPARTPAASPLNAPCRSRFGPDRTAPLGRTG
ncbi:MULTISPECIES: hypothetical protein [unclassified Streptomyces]|uniref:hypothetical protein n=1 Tax=unclassified Streptomyces TaxID=2593676 RepID=UPI00324883AD